MGKKLTIYIIDNIATSPRTIEIGNWSGKAIFSQRSALSKIIEREEFNKPGVYMLKSLPKNENYSERIYIGEAENLRRRLKEHLANSEKDFIEVVIFISKDEMLTKSHIKYLESKIITYANEAKTAEIDNSIQPSLSILPEADISDMEYFLEQIKLILPVVNFMFLVPTTVKHVENSSSKEVEAHEQIIYSIKTKRVDARLLETEEGYIVLAGSQSIKEPSSSIADGWLKQRRKLIETNILKDIGEFYEFTEDTIFSSISAAAAIILGRQAAGPNEWIDSQGRTYKYNQEQKYNIEI